MASRVSRFVSSSLAVSLVAFLIAGPTAAPAVAKQRKPKKVSVLTQNLYYGADLNPAIAALATDPANASDAITSVWAVVESTDFHTRAQALANEIAEKKPVLVGLQEAAMWRIDAPSDGSFAPPNAATVQYDFVQELLDELRARHLRYVVAASATGLDIEVPYLPTGTAEPRDLRLTDRDVILVRKGVKFSNPQSGTYAAAIPLPIGEEVYAPNQWVSVDVKWKRRRFRFVSTHLADGVEQVARPQAAELLAGPLATELPVVLVGDFNSDVAADYVPVVYQDIVAAGLTDAWAALRPGEPGLTWGQAEGLDNAAPQLTQRLDYVFTQGGAEPFSIDIVGEEVGDRLGGLWPSDHAGISAVIELQ